MHLLPIEQPKAPVTGGLLQYVVEALSKHRQLPVEWKNNAILGLMNYKRLMVVSWVASAVLVLVSALYTRQGAIFPGYVLPALALVCALLPGYRAQLYAERVLREAVAHLGYVPDDLKGMVYHADLLALIARESK